MSDLKVSLFGKLQIQQGNLEIPGIECRKVQELLSYLLLFRHHSHPRDRLCETLWGDQLTDPRYSPNIDQIPAVKDATEKIFVFQQIVYDEAGQIEPTPEGGGNFNAYNSKRV